MTDGTEGRIIASLKGERKRKDGNADLIRGEHKKRGGSISMKKSRAEKNGSFYRGVICRFITIEMFSFELIWCVALAGDKYIFGGGGGGAGILPRRYMQIFLNARWKKNVHFMVVLMHFIFL